MRLRYQSVLIMTGWILAAGGRSAATEPAAPAGPDDGSRPQAIGVAQPAAKSPGNETWRAGGFHGAVAAGGPGREAVEAGLAILQEGGNAADAAAATLLVLCVIDPGNFCFGGEIPMLVYDARRGVVEVICGLGAAPRLATLDRFRDGGIPRAGAAAAAVPGAFDAIVTLLDRAGSVTLARAARPMLAALEARHDGWCRDLTHTMQQLIAAEATASDRRQGLRRAADCFYRGPIARQIDAWSRASGGLLRHADLATHVTRVEEPVTADYRGYTVAKCGPWTQGPMLLESLQLLEGFDVRGMRPDAADYMHLATESLKLALADRDAFYGDPLYADVPLAGLLDPAYAATRRPLIDASRASRELRPGRPVGPPAGSGGTSRQLPPAPPLRDTTTCVVADALGNVVAATPSGWAGAVAGDTGVQLGSRLQSFNVQPGHPNCIEPGKRPRITLTPTLVLRQGRPVLAVSVAGGDLQDQVTLQMLVDCLDFDLSPAAAVVRPRFATDHHVGSFGQTPPRPGSLAVDDGVEAAAVDRLVKLGHDVSRVRPPIAHPCVIRIDPATGRKEAAGDPRARRQAAAY